MPQLPQPQELTWNSPRMLLVGDVHGAVRPLEPAFQWATAANASDVVLLGDLELFNYGLLDTTMGLALNDLLVKHDLRLHLIRGNHDEDAPISRLPRAEDGCRLLTDQMHILDRTAIIHVGENVIAAAAGAASLDYTRPREVLDQDERDGLLRAAAEIGQIDVVLGHDNVGVWPGTSLWTALEPTAELWSRDLVERAREQSRLYGHMVRQLRPRLAVGGHLHLHHQQRLDLGRPEPSTAIVLSMVESALHEPAFALLDLSRRDRITLTVPATELALREGWRTAIEV